MDQTSLCQNYYEHYNHAVNNPQKFLNSLKKLRKMQLVPIPATLLLEIKANISLGNIGHANQLLQGAKELLEQESESFYRAQLYLLDHTLLSATSSASERSRESLQLAEQHHRQCGSKALECEVLIATVYANSMELEITLGEDILKRAMQLAVETDLPDLMIAVYLAFIQFYQSHQLPNQAERELQMLDLVIDRRKHVYRNVQMLNHKALNQMILKNYRAAEAILTEALEIATEMDFKVQISTMHLNRGICKLRLNEFTESLEFFEMGLKVLESIDFHQSSLVAKITVSKANCLAFMGKLKESADTIRTNLENYRATGDELQVHVQAVNLADVLIEVQEFDEAETLLDKAIEYFSSTSNHGYLQNAHLCKARFYEVQLRYQEAFSCMEELHQASQQYFRDNFAKQTQRFQHRIEELRTEYQILKSRCAAQGFDGPSKDSNKLLGDHPQIKKALSEALLAARHPYANVIIQGESGTGKEVLARIIHYADSAEKPLVAINAAAIPPSLIESELFGHVKGAFTGAVSDYKGKFLLANGGTLFLDEISEMPMEVQAKLLRAIEYQTITPVGSNKEYAVKCRIICATNVKLNHLIRSSKFRLDLYHRLNKVEIYLPALRERIGDLESLTNHFVKNLAKEQGLAVPEVARDFLDRLARYSFPGNIRELRNIIERIFILKYKHLWEAELLDGLLQDEQDVRFPADAPMTANLDKVEYDLILNALNQCNWVQKEAARLLEISESTLTRHMQKLGIKRNKRQ